VTGMAISSVQTSSSTASARAKPPASRDAATLWRTAFIIVVLVLWELLARGGVLDEAFASKPSSLVQAAGHLLTDADVDGALGSTLLAVGASFVIGTALGVVVGVVLGLQNLLRQAYFPIVMLLLGTPKSVFLPVIVLFFGLDQTSAIVFGSILTFVHVTVNVVAGVDLVEQKHLTVARAFGASKWRRFVDVIIPGASPGLFTAMWHGLRNAFTGVVIAQLFTAAAGVGYLVRVYSNNFQTDRALSLVLMMSIVVILVGTGWSRLEKRLTRWREKEFGT